MQIVNPLGPSDPFILFRDDKAQREILFAEPSDIIIAESPADFENAFTAAQAAHEEGKWLAGYLSYEAGYLLEPKLAPILPEDRRAPLLCFGVFDGPSERAFPERDSLPQDNAFLSPPRAAWTFEEYEKRFSRLHRHLREGDCYQGNLTFPVHARWSGDPLAAFDALTTRQPVRYGAFSRLGGPVILSRSPELFFDVNADGWIEAHPMKGTTPRGQTPEEDDRLRDFLINDPKSQAENRMIVDLLRNDISLISEPSTLHVPELFKVERYPTVHQMISRVRARLNPGLKLREIFAALFPCGSVTGAPKIRAMEILRGLEGVPRDIYCGSIGWIAPQGRMRFNVAIRTISLYPDGHATFNIGGGIVFDSTAEAEYEECLLKARFATGMVPTTN
ncbi:aminodeoxychorismate synthase component I [Phyllobacterium salinisoli]|uniref:Aminodeoxychorismate synthase component I n=1 Tax=Phyllobacterium salinisoli TaxID=1899321 RepID=A0A368K3G4_9HYPH|nr:aminodeoxychorismate synthase component I [Phyllobacterium salinisoli]RCS23929.1 aminodeoxychorismate synthase component I [Phyllobacterium salinisoli]